MLPQNKKLILFGSVKITDKRKGAEYLIEACKLLAEKHPEWKESHGSLDKRYRYDNAYNHAKDCSERA
jgi:hypothetical protein